MISIIEGKVVKVAVMEKLANVDVMTSVGIGYRIHVPTRVNVSLGTKTTFYTSFQVREDSQNLYGFLSELERDFFELLITVSGVGPKVAISILSTYTPDQVGSYIMSNNYMELAKVSGLGKKKAQKIVIELGGKIESWDLEFSDVKLVNNILMQELKSALKSLGFAKESLSSYLKKGEEISGEVESLDELIKRVLKET